MKKITYNYSFIIKHTNVNQPKKRYAQGWVWEDLKGKASAPSGLSSSWHVMWITNQEAQWRLGVHGFYWGFIKKVLLTE